MISALRIRFRHGWRLALKTARLAVGIPDYDTYVAHLRHAHPAQTPMPREDFFTERLHARYGRGRTRCC